MNKSKKLNLSSKDVYDLVETVFLKVEEFVDSKESPQTGIKKILDELPVIDAVKPDIRKFPRIGFSLSSDEVLALKRDGFLDEKNRLSSGLASLETLSPMEKLLYSVLWKQGDLGKESHIVMGILGIANSDQGLVFNYFGQHLENKVNPIIDQHVIRAFRIKRISFSDQEVKRIRSKDLAIGKKDTAEKIMVIEKYLQWHKEQREKYPDYMRNDFTYYLDLLLFGLGKHIKFTGGTSTVKGEPKND